MTTTTTKKKEKEKVEKFSRARESAADAHRSRCTAPTHVGYVYLCACVYVRTYLCARVFVYHVLQASRRSYCTVSTQRCTPHVYTHTHNLLHVFRVFIFSSFFLSLSLVTFVRFSFFSPRFPRILLSSGALFPFVFSFSFSFTFFQFFMSSFFSIVISVNGNYQKFRNN